MLVQNVKDFMDVMSKKGIKVVDDMTFEDLMMDFPLYASIYQQVVNRVEKKPVDRTKPIPFTEHNMLLMAQIEQASTRDEVESLYEQIMYDSREMCITYLIETGMLNEHDVEKYRSSFAWAYDIKMRPIITSAIYELVQ